MAKTLSTLLQEADELIQTKTAGISAKNAPEADPEDDIFKLAESVRQGGTSKEGSSDVSDEVVYTLVEKIAHAAAIADVWQNLPTLIKIASFEEQSRAQGRSNEQIADFLEKNASQFPMRSVFQG